MSATDVAKLEQENARLGVALSDAYGVLGKTKTALEQLQAEYDALNQQLDWFKRQLFGQKSEKRFDIDPAEQLNLLAGGGGEGTAVVRRCADPDRQLRASREGARRGGRRERVALRPEVPVQTIEVRDPAIEAIAEPEREVIGEKVSYRLAQQPGSFVVLKYIRKVVKRLDTGMRRAEVFGLEWARVDMGRAVLRIEDTKSGEPLVFPVTRQLAAILDRRLAERERFPTETRGWVFPSELSGSGHLEGMQHLNARIGEAGGAKFWFHALRNCFISVADRDLMLPASLTKRLVNHSRPQDVTEGYAADWTMEQLRDAAQRIADKIDELIRAGAPAPAARAA